MVDREFIRGFTKLYALWRGSQKDAYGMAIMREMRKVGFELSPGTLYPTLATLEREGDIVWRRQVVAGRVRKTYRLTAKGKKELGEVKERLRVLVRLVFGR
jgi:PadR family transcriptional regulator, regulatory protein PadR